MSERFEEYIEAIFEIMRETGEDHAHTNEIAVKMGNRPASVTEMLRKLSKKGYVVYKAYYGAWLTAKGRGLAEDLKKRHQALLRFLTLIGVPKGTADRDACEIEHHLDPVTAKKLVKFVELLDGSEPGKRLLLRLDRS